MSLVGVMKSGRSLDQHYEFMAESGEDRHYQFARLEMIVNIYGDSVRKEYDDAIKARTKLNEIAAEFEQTYRTGGTGTSYLKGYVAAQQNFEKAVGNLTGSIAKGANQLSID
jgi:hypothetical protein